MAYKALSTDAVVGLMLPCNVRVEASPAGDGTIVCIVNPEAMMMVGSLGQNAALREVAQQAKAKLERVAERLLEES